LGVEGWGVGFMVYGFHSVDYEGFGTPKFLGEVSEFAPHKALKLIAWRQVDF